MKRQDKTQVLQNAAQSLQNALAFYKFPEKYFIYPTADGRTKQMFGIASNSENGGIVAHSRFMTYEECNAYIVGVGHAKKGMYLEELTTA